MDTLSIILSILFSIVGFLISWLALSSYRFQIYSLYESVEEPIRCICTKISFLENILSLPQDKQLPSIVIESMADEIYGKVMTAGIYGEEVENLIDILIKMQNFNCCVKSECLNTLRSSLWAIDRLLGACRDEKKN